MIMIMIMIKHLIPEDIFAEDDNLLGRRSILLNMEGANLDPVRSIGVSANIRLGGDDADYLEVEHDGSNIFAIVFVDVTNGP